jgi:RsiW-degrading membrane proteinase PrsW (M82 family)
MFFLVALKVGLVWFAVLLALFRPPMAEIPRLARTMVLGMVVCAPAGFFNTYWLNALDGTIGGGIASRALLWILVAPVEEILKYTIVRVAAGGRRRTIEHPRDGCLLAACSALGFATFENYFYMEQMGYNVIHIRGWLCSAGHMLWSAVWGYYLGLVWMGRAPRGAGVAEGLILASLAHGVYNFLCGLVKPPLGLLIPVAAVLALGRFFKERLYTGLHQPWLAKMQARALGLVVPSELVFGEDRARGPALIAKMGDDDENVRAAAVAEASAVDDQRTYERVIALTRDPVPAVRTAAAKASGSMRERLVKAARTSR